MDIESLRNYCLSLDAVSESFPFGEGTLVFKTNDKIFLLLSLDAQPPRFNVKCDPERALLLREQYSAILPGYHMNKKHWNTIVLDGSLNAQEIKAEIMHSYGLISAKKTKQKKS
ncbi:MmcQ-like protein [Taibaiella sp. KBW10]|uniref:MmcQ/YjbR family DNA-binding protein n=1 Tax=Taibaiella sp. KBW10 TaxID=2153357 RepID=UPI000F5B0A6F|nr:MmcQ/YjbR family DNA-binding protein [Taibaiella sp. KBW10]RQO32395.1 MmcQ-like protein [Taibaiella sp. KBW10]